MITLISITLILVFFVLDLNTFFSIIEYECNAEKTINPYQPNSINYSIEYDNGLD
mgnify:CR=1 FL=1